MSCPRVRQGWRGGWHGRLGLLVGRWLPWPPVRPAASPSLHPATPHRCSPSAAVTGNSVSRLQQLHTEAEAWQRPATAGRFAAALRRQRASLRQLLLGGASGLTEPHLASLRALCALETLCLAGTRGAVSSDLVADAAAGCPNLASLDLSATPAGDGCLAAAAALPRLARLAAAGCGRISSAGVAALAAGPAAASLRALDLSHTSADDGAIAALAAGARGLRVLRLMGCHALTPAAVDALCTLSRLRALALGRCPAAVTDAGLAALADALPQLTRLSLTEAAQLSADGLAAALPRMRVLAQLDLTACAGGRLSDDAVLHALSPAGGGVTPANIALPQGGTAPTGSPFRRRAAPPPQ